MGKSSANISRNMYDEVKRYQLLVHQQGVPWVEADENDRNWIFYNLLRRFIQKVIGNGSPDDGFKIVGTAVNDFVITGGDGTPEGAGRLLVEGFQCILPESKSYRGSDTLECSPVSTGLTETVLTDSAANFTDRCSTSEVFAQILLKSGQTNVLSNLRVAQIQIQQEHIMGTVRRHGDSKVRRCQ